MPGLVVPLSVVVIAHNMHKVELVVHLCHIVRHMDDMFGSANCRSRVQIVLFEGFS